jgi:hypothetical protein
MKARTSLLGLSVFLVFLGCSTLDVEQEFQTVVKEEGERFIIIDQVGEEWDVTDAFQKYNMIPELFENGLGKNALRPYINPEMISPGERNYPPTTDTEIVIGTTIGGESRAYPIAPLNYHEIVDDNFGDVHVAVGW